MPSRDILILSDYLDYHAAAVDWGLRLLGQHPLWWQRSLFPAQQYLNIHLSTEGARVSGSGHGTELDTQCNRFKAIWNRRAGRPSVPQSAHPADALVIKNEAQRTLNSALELLAALNVNSLFINSRVARDQADHKLLQLQVARSIGFNIPNTLSSNDAKEVKKFYELNDGKVVAKYNFPFKWRSGSKGFPLYTTAVSESDLEDVNSIEFSPTIFQEDLDIVREIRCTCFGRTAFSGFYERKIAAQSLKDKRDVRLEGQKCKFWPTPEWLQQLLYKYMEHFDLRFAAFDIAETSGGNFYFLEANESGQFLFMELDDPSIPILDAFCKFLASGDKLYRFADPSKRITMKNFGETDRSRRLIEKLEEMRNSGAPGEFCIDE